VQNPTIPAVTKAAEGVYTVTYTRMNCSSTDTMSITLQPEIKLKDVTAARYQIAFGDSVQLFASGASFYVWSPHNKTLNDYYIPNPIAYPTDSISTFSVLGMNEWGCRDSASITLRVVFDEEEYIPNSFTPNNDGLNDIFRIGKMRFKKLVDFTIFNRWGQEVYHNAWDPTGGWDGTTNGVKQDIGVYYYSIIIESASGKLRYYKGDVTLLR
jgi:gliding motility-associated-like protein